MRAVVQRVKECSVVVDGQVVSRIDAGILVYAGLEKGDTQKDINYIVNKVSGLRIFEDDGGKMNLSVVDLDQEIMAVSQFTLCADVRRGKRPSFDNAMNPDEARKMFDVFVSELKKVTSKVQSGVFQAMMEVDYRNMGPVTILLDSRKKF